VCEKSAGSDFVRDPSARSAAVAALARARSLLLTTHVRPDGDALGSVLGLHLAARGAGKSSQMVVPDAIPRRYSFLFRGGSPAGPEQFGEMADRAELIVVLDTCAAAQLEPIVEEIRARREKVLVLDHHATADDLGAVVWRERGAAAAAVMVHDVLAELGWVLDAGSAEALLTGICGDTGWFRHANTDPAALRAAAALMEAGADPEALYARLYQRDRPQRLRLLSAALGSLALSAEGRLAVMSLGRDDFLRTGAEGDETEDFVNEPLRVAGVEVSVLLVAERTGGTRVSLRSRGRVDVAELAGRFGGGGHARAAGFRSREDLAAVRERVATACMEVLRRVGAEGSG